MWQLDPLAMNQGGVGNLTVEEQSRFLGGEA